MEIAVADRTGVAKATCYNPDAFSKFKLNKQVILKNYIVREDKTIFITRISRVVPAGFITKDFSMFDHDALVLLNPPDAPTKSINEAKKSPIKSHVSVEGTLVEDHAPRTVTVRMEPDVPVRDITIADSTGKVRVALWRSLASSSVETGSFIKVTNCSVGQTKRQGDYTEEIQLSLTMSTTVSVSIIISCTS
ncbi:uncharacterized protein [Amphiura filiformis]|uniref:uncharacterized protein n=1 Tax=Amphiura filiformis TaxID=82378 RepID=UPI003B224536